MELAEQGDPEQMMLVSQMLEAGVITVLQVASSVGGA